MEARKLDFVSLTKNLEINERAFKYEMSVSAPPTECYVVFFVARSGSTWLTSILSATNLLGYPEEYLNPEFVPDVARSLNAKTPDTFISVLQRRRKSENGIFGVEVRAIDVELFGAREFFSNFDSDTVFFNLWRKNILAQAISLYRAVLTGRFHSNDGKEEHTHVLYDAEAIKNWLNHLAEQENSNISMLKNQQKLFTNLCYEVIVKDRIGTIQLFADKLAVKRGAFEISKTENEDIQKIADSWNAEAERRFRSEHTDFLVRIEKSRLIRQYENF